MNASSLESGSMDRVEAQYRIKEVEAALARRLEHAEGQHARLLNANRVLIVCSIAAIGFAAFGWRRASLAYSASRDRESVEAQSFVLADADGIRRATLAADGSGSVDLGLMDREGRERLRLSVLADGSPGISLVDAEGRSRAVFGLLPDGTTNLVFADARGSTRAVVGVSPDGASRVIFADPEGATRAALGVDEAGAPILRVVELDEAAVGDSPAPTGDPDTPGGDADTPGGN